MRLFVAIELPPPLEAAIASLQGILRRSDVAVRWVDPHNAHFTLKFLGEVSPNDLMEIDAAVRPAAAEFRPMALEIAGLGTFPSRGRPRVIWVGIEGAIDALGGLHARVDERLADAGFAAERRPFRAHVTLGRANGNRGIDHLVSEIERRRDLRLGTFSAREAVLFESHLSRRGPRYEILSRYPFAGGRRS